MQLIKTATYTGLGIVSSLGLGSCKQSNAAKNEANSKLQDTLQITYFTNNRSQSVC